MIKERKIEVILIASADEKNAQNLASRLRTQGYQVRQTSGGFQTLSLIEDDPKKVDCVIFLGFNLDEMGTSEALLHIRTKWSKEQMCVFQLGDDEKKLFNSISEGANHALNPKNFNDVLTRLKSVIIA